MLPGVVHAKSTHSYVDEFHGATMSQAFTEAVYTRYEANDTDTMDIPFLMEQRAIVCSLDTEPASNVAEGMDNVKEN